MEVQSPQSVQINFNNKIITLHNVTIVKNPKIITLDASQYSNLLKGSPLKLASNNGTASSALPSPASGLIKSTPVKNNLIPVKTTPSPSNNVVKQIPKLGVLQFKSPPGAAQNTFKIQSMSPSSVIATPPKIVNNVQTPMKVQLKPFQSNSFVISKPPAKVVISPPQKRKLETSPTIVQPEAKKVCNDLPYCCIFCKDVYADSNLLIEHMKANHPESLKVPKGGEVIIPQNGNAEKSVIKQENWVEKKPIMVSNVKLSNFKPMESSAQQKLILNTQQIPKSTPKIVISPKMFENNSPIVKKSPTVVKSSPTSTSPISKVVTPEKSVNSSPVPVCQPSTSKTSPIIQDVANESMDELVEISNSHVATNPTSSVEKIRKKPGRKPKYPDGMKPVKIKRAYNKTGKYSKLNPNGSVQNADATPPVPKKRGRKPKSMMNGTATAAEPKESTLKVPDETSKKDSSSENEKSKKNSSDESDDESEVRDLLMDVEDEQDSVRSSSPESPEFEEIYPTASIAKYENDGNGFDYDDYEYCSNIMEPICELSCEDDSGDENRQDENDEAMRLYREAMEVNYQANGIKKRGRRRKRAKPLMENFNEINGILAGLLEETAFKVPKGPGRGRRKEMNEVELEMERSNGACLFSCNKCDETFKYAGDLAKHVRSHTINSPYQCTICQRKFTHIGSLNTHLRIHSGERPYKCNQCDKSFTQSNSLMVHVKSHLSNKPFQCLQCNKGFLNASSLALHQKTHAEPTSVICPIDDCLKEFRDSNLLEEHMQTHKHSMLYQCSLCSEKFEQSATLVQHVKTHIGDKPFQCNQCGKCFTQPGSLNTHLRIHTGEKPFKCEVCGKSFTQASSLSVHMKVHGEKEFKCLMDNCNRSFGQEIYLKKHMLKHIENSLNDENAQFNNE